MMRNSNWGRVQAARYLILTLLGLAIFLSATANSHEFRTRRGTPIEHWHYLGNVMGQGFPQEIKDTYGFEGPGWLVDLGDTERTYDPTQYFPDPPNSLEWSNQQAIDIVKRDKKAFPNITEIGPATKAYNCHGYTFFMYPQLGDGVALDDTQKIVIEGALRNRYPNGAVGEILRDNGWVNVTNAHQYQRHDVILYRKAGSPHPYYEHSGRVFGVSADGTQVTEVISKWGENGLYVHPVADVLESYGLSVSIWRQGRRLTGNAENDPLPKRRIKERKQ